MRLEDGEEAGVFPGLLDEVAGAAADGFDGQIDVAPGGHDDDGDLRVDFLDAGDEVEAFLSGGSVAGVVEVDEEAVEAFAGESFDGERGRADDFEGVPFGGEEELKGFEDVGLVVGDEEAAR